MTSRLTCLAALLALAMTACTSPSPPVKPPIAPVAIAQPASPTPTPTPTPAVEPTPVIEATKPLEARKPSRVASPLTGTWEGEWEIDDYGFTGKAVLVIDRVEGRIVTGRSIMFDTPYGKLDEPFVAASFDAGRLSVRHRKNVSYTLSLNERGRQLTGPFVYSTASNTFTGKITVNRR